MIEQISKYLAKSICNSNINGKDKYEIIAYGIEIILATVINIIVVLLIALIFNKLTVTIVYLGVFMAFRTYTGGYHSKTHFRCCSLLVFTVIMEYILLKILNANLVCSSFLLLIFSHIIVFFFAPIADANKPISASQRKFSRKICIVESVLLWCVALVLYTTNQNELLFSASYGSGITGASVLAVVIINNISKKGDEISEQI